jgi:DNA replication and repair protein RecF
VRVHRLATTHFRSLAHEPLAFCAGVNLFVGENGAGKTNLLEALCFFKIGRSFRTARDADLVNLSQPFCRVEVRVGKGEAPGCTGGRAEGKSAPADAFAAAIERNGTKRIQVNAKEVEKLSDLVGLYPCVLFGPQDLGLVSGGPEERRRYLDVTGSTTDRFYLEDLRGYRRVLGQRNALLKGRPRRSERNVWDEELVRRGCAVVEKRQALVEALFSHLTEHVEGLGFPYAVELRYDSDVLSDLPEGVAAGAHYQAKLAGVEEEETRRGLTLVGPHRDDVRILLDGRDVRRFGSQGQKRLLAVLLRLTELSYADARTGERCVLLLDDVFSELDAEASGRLRSILEDDHQVFVTSPVALEWGGARDVKVFQVEKGHVGG